VTVQSIFKQDFPQLFDFIEEDKLAVFYDPSRRSFGIGTQEGHAVQEIYYCPWSGKKLPTPLSAQFGDMLESQDLSALEEETWPEEWRSEAWWIRAGK
jgi:hypothetical protein